MLEFSVRPSGVAGLYHATVRALDDTPSPTGSFTLTEWKRALENLAASRSTSRSFESQTLEINKIAEQRRAEIGDIVSYRVEVRNTTQAALREVSSAICCRNRSTTRRARRN
jgi:hypothetical protein